MDKRQRAINIIKNYYIEKEQNNISDMIKSVCSYFDFVKNQKLLHFFVLFLLTNGDFWTISYLGHIFTKNTVLYKILRKGPVL